METRGLRSSKLGLNKPGRRFGCTLCLEPHWCKGMSVSCRDQRGQLLKGRQRLAKRTDLAVRAGEAARGLEERESSGELLRVLTPPRGLRELFCFFKKCLVTYLQVSAHISRVGVKFLIHACVCTCNHHPGRPSPSSQKVPCALP